MFGDVTFAQAPFASLGGNTFAVAQSELAVAGSSFDSPGVARGGRMDEVIAGQDAQVAVTTLRPTQDESAAASSAQSVIANMLANMQEQAATTAAQTVIGTFLASQAESSAATDAQIAVGTFLAAQDETATGADSANRGLLVFVAIAESATGTATQVSQAVFRGTVAEAVSALSTLGVVKEANVYPTGVQLSISIGGALVWATISTNQSPDWTQLPS